MTVTEALLHDSRPAHTRHINASHQQNFDRTKSNTIAAILGNESPLNLSAISEPVNSSAMNVSRETVPILSATLPTHFKDKNSDGIKNVNNDVSLLHLDNLRLFEELKALKNDYTIAVASSLDGSNGDYSSIVFERNALENEALIEELEDVRRRAISSFAKPTNVVRSDESETSLNISEEDRHLLENVRSLQNIAERWNSEQTRLAARLTSQSAGRQSDKEHIKMLEKQLLDLEADRDKMKRSVYISDIDKDYLKGRLKKERVALLDEIGIRTGARSESKEILNAISKIFRKDDNAASERAALIDSVEKANMSLKAAQRKFDLDRDRYNRTLNELLIGLGYSLPSGHQEYDIETFSVMQLTSHKVQLSDINFTGSSDVATRVERLIFDVTHTKRECSRLRLDSDTIQSLSDIVAAAPSRSEIEHLRADIKRAQAHAEELRTKMTQQTNRKELQYSEENVRLQAQLAESVPRTELQTLKLSLEKNEELRLSLQKDLDNAPTTALVADLREQLETSEQRRDAMSEQLTEAERELMVLSGDPTKLDRERQIDQFKCSLNRLNNELQAEREIRLGLERALALARDEERSLGDEKVAQLRKQLNIKGSELNALQNAFENANNDCNNTVKALKATRCLVERSDNECEKMSAEIQILTTEASTAASEVSKLRSDVSDYESKLHTQRIELEESRKAQCVAEDALAVVKADLLRKDETLADSVRRVELADVALLEARLELDSAKEAKLEVDRIKEVWHKEVHDVRTDLQSEISRLQDESRISMTCLNKENSETRQKLLNIQDDLSKSTNLVKELHTEVSLKRENILYLEEKLDKCLVDMTTNERRLKDECSGLLAQKDEIRKEKDVALLLLEEKLDKYLADAAVHERRHKEECSVLIARNDEIEIEKSIALEKVEQLKYEIDKVTGDVHRLENELVTTHERHLATVEMVNKSASDKEFVDREFRALNEKHRSELEILEEQCRKAVAEMETKCVVMDQDHQAYISRLTCDLEHAHADVNHWRTIARAREAERDNNSGRIDDLMHDNARTLDQLTAKHRDEMEAVIRDMNRSLEVPFDLKAQSLSEEVTKYRLRCEEQEAEICSLSSRLHTALIELQSARDSVEVTRQAVHGLQNRLIDTESNMRKSEDTAAVAIAKQQEERSTSIELTQKLQQIHGLMDFVCSDVELFARDIVDMLNIDATLPLSRGQHHDDAEYDPGDDIVRQVGENLRALSHALMAYKENLSNHDQDVQQHIAELQKTIGHLEAEKCSIQKELSRLNEDVSERAQHHETERKRLTDDVEHGIRYTEELQEKLKESVKLRHQMISKITEEFQEKQLTLDNEAMEQQSRLSYTETQLTASRNELIELHSELDRALASKKSFQEHLAERERAATQMLEAHATKIQRLHALLDDTSTALRVLKTTLSKKEIECVSLKSEKDMLSSEIILLKREQNFEFLEKSLQSSSIACADASRDLNSSPQRPLRLQHNTSLSTHNGSAFAAASAAAAKATTASMSRTDPSNQRVSNMGVTAESDIYARLAEKYKLPTTRRRIEERRHF